jgi:peptidoglycan/xylan/chitin deacetylase (PgdA/CDA1 family)
MSILEIARHLEMYLPRRLWLARLLKETAELRIQGRDLKIILSSDTEFDPPLENETWTTRSTRLLFDGLPTLLSVCDRFDISMTLFCEGRLVAGHPDLFRELRQEHEIGCHSYAHEWFGTRPPRIWIPHVEECIVLSSAEKTRILKRAMECIAQVVGRRPTSFKAPFNSVDHSVTLRLLEQAGFETDSSLPCYYKESFLRPLRPAPTRHTSETDLWGEGRMRLIEVPFMTRAKSLLLHPFDTREEVMDTCHRSMRLALESVDIQCRIDYLLGMDFSLLHLQSHPWEFSEIRPWGGRGKANARVLAEYFDQLSAKYNVQFLTVGQFAKKWDSEQSRIHAPRAYKTTRSE